MITLENLNPNPTFEAGYEPTLEIKINVKELKKEYPDLSLDEILHKQSESNKPFVSEIYKSLLKLFNTTQISIEMTQMVNDIKNSETIIYKRYSCGSCGSTGPGGTHWIRECMNDHCYCPTCVA